MKTLHMLLKVLTLGCVAAKASAACEAPLQGEYRKLHSSESVSLCKLVENRVSLIVNTASHCGFTKQFKGLETINKQYAGRGLVVLGFASDDFNQEDSDEGKAAGICFGNFGVTFTMLAPTHVRGSEANALFQYLGAQTAAPKWNFNKYLLGRDGKVIAHFGSMTGPESADLIQAIETALAH